MSNSVVAPTTLTRDHRYYDDAVDLSRLSNHNTSVGAVMANNTKKLAGAFNTIRNDARNVPYGSATYHAEHNVVRMVPARLRSRATLYVARLNKAGGEMPSRPCLRCRKLLVELEVSEVVYLDSTGKLVKEYI